MPAISRAVGSSSVYLGVFIPDATVSTGAGLANISLVTISCSWWRNNMSAVSTFSASSGTLGTWGSSTIAQANSSLALGWYGISLPNGMFASGDSAFLHLYGATNMAPVPILVELTLTDNQKYVSSQVYSSTNQILGVTNPMSVSSISIPVSVSSLSVPVGVSSISTPVTVSSNTDKGNYGVSSISIQVSVSAVAIPVSVSGASLPFGVSSISVPVGVSSISIPVSVSSISVGVNASSVGDKTGYSLTAAEEAAIADAFLNRNVSGGANTGRLVKESLYVLRNKVDTNLGIVYQTDDLSSSWAFQVSTVAGNPIQVISPL